MAKDLDGHDPLELLMQEWALISTWFWLLLLGATACMFGPSHLPILGCALMAAALGLPLLKIGPTLVIVANELRKQAKSHEASGPSDSEEESQAPQFRR